MVMALFHGRNSSTPIARLLRIKISMPSTSVPMRYSTRPTKIKAVKSTLLNGAQHQFSKMLWTMRQTCAQHSTCSTKTAVDSLMPLRLRLCSGTTWARMRQFGNKSSQRSISMETVKSTLTNSNRCSSNSQTKTNETAQITQLAGLDIEGYPQFKVALTNSVIKFVERKQERKAKEWKLIGEVTPSYMEQKASEL